MTKQYISFTDAEKAQARQTDLAELLKQRGETVKRVGAEYEWLDGSQKVSIRGNLWYHQYEQQGGDAIDFVKRFYSKSYAGAVEFLLKGAPGAMAKAHESRAKERAEKEFILPPRNDNMRRAMAYLIYTRGIDRDVAATFAHHGMIYESLPHHNVVFVGYDSSGTARHAHLRGAGKESTFKGNAANGAPEFSFHWHGRSDELYIFESPIDMISYISMNNEHWNIHSYAACCGVGDRVLFQMLEDNKSISKIYLCLDNDEAGQAANKRISDKLFMRGFQSEILVPVNKDWNEDLLSPGEEEEQCPALRL